jgi:glycosyltransferase involved in cell wall biosynthesis
MGRPLVSVIIVVSNGERYIRSALESIFGQDYSPYEIIVVDGKSADRTAAIVQSYASVNYICQEGQGLANARNTGIEAARGDLVAFLDADDLWTTDKLTVQVEYLLHNPEIQYVNAWVKLFVEPGYRPRSGYTRRFLNHSHVGRTPGTLVIRSSVFKLVGLFNEDFSIACDAEWFTRASEFSMPTYIIPAVLLYKRIHQNNLSSNINLNKRELMTVIRQSLIRQRRKIAGVYCGK